MGYMTCEELAQHLCESGVEVSTDKQKRQLLNSGYFHGYKGYRFFKSSCNRIPFVSYDEVKAVIRYDSKLKSLFYSKIMFIETAVKNIALEQILLCADSENISDMMSRLVCSYNNAPADWPENKKRKCQQDKLNLQNVIQGYLAREYSKGNSKITHFYDKGYTEVPIWALFEVMMMGDFGFLLSCLTYEVRDKISQSLGINMAYDTNRELIYKYFFALKDMRNAVAHNAVLFDVRFRRINPSSGMTQCLKVEMNLPYVNFKTIGDYAVLISYYLKLLKVPKEEIINFIELFEQMTEEYKNSVNESIYKITVHADFNYRMSNLKNNIKLLEN